MGKLYLHDIPVETFVKYYMNNDINSKIINENTRYKPQYDPYIATYKYSYLYRIGDDDFNVYTVNQPSLVFNEDIIKKVFNPDLYYYYSNDDAGTVEYYTNHQTRLITPALNTILESTLRTINSDNDFSTYLNNNYEKINGYEAIKCTNNGIVYRFVTNEDYSHLSSSVINNNKVNKIFTTNDSGIVSNISEQVYFIPLSDSVASYFNNVSLYEYYGTLGDRIFYSLKYDEDENNFYYVFNERNEESVKLLSLLNDSNSTARYSIDSRLSFDKANNCYFHMIYVDGSTKEVGRIYKLPKYNKIKMVNGKAEYLDTFKNQNVYFDSTNQPVSAIVKYHNYMRNYKNTINTNDAANESDAAVYKMTNTLYFHKYSEVTTIGYAYKYLRTTQTPVGNEMVNTPLGGIISTIKTTPIDGNPTSSTINPNGLLRTLINFVGIDDNFKIKATSIYYKDDVIDTSSIPTGTAHVETKEQFQVAELKSFNDHIKEICNTLNDHRAETDYYSSRIKTAFSTENIHIIRKYDTMSSSNELVKDTTTNPYNSQGISIKDIEKITPDSDGFITVNLINKPHYNKYKQLNNISKFLVLDVSSTITSKASDKKILEDGYYYYYELAEEAMESSSVSKNLGNGKYYRIKLMPLGTYLVKFIESQNRNTQTLYNKPYNYSRNVNGASYLYEIDWRVLHPVASDSETLWNALNGEANFKKIQQVFAGYNLYFSEDSIDESTKLMPYVPVKYGTNTRERKTYSAVDYLFNKTINNEYSAVNVPLSTSDNYTISSYFSSLFKNLLYVTETDFYHNNGGLCYDMSNNTYINGFINYDRTKCLYDYGESKTFANGLYDKPDINISEKDIKSIKYSVESKHPLDRLFNYKTYTINAQEIANLSNEKVNNIYLNKIQNSETFINYNLSKSEKMYNIQSFDISDTVNKCFDLYTEYLYTPNRKLNQKTNRYNIDEVNEIDTSEIESASSQYTLNAVYSLLNNQSFYRKDISNYISKLNDDHNEFQYVNNEEYELRYLFTHTENDKNVFIELLKALNKDVS